MMTQPRCNVLKKDHYVSRISRALKDLVLENIGRRHYHEGYFKFLSSSNIICIVFPHENTLWLHCYIVV